MHKLIEDSEQTRYQICPACNHNRTIFDEDSGRLRCMVCNQTWNENLYVLSEFPDDTSHFEQNGIGYPSFQSVDNGARYVPECDYIRHFKKEPPTNAYYKLLMWPESQPYLFPNDANESTYALCEPIMDEKGIAAFGQQAVWVPLCLL